MPSSDFRPYNGCVIAIAVVVVVAILVALPFVYVPCCCEVCR